MYIYIYILVWQWKRSALISKHRNLCRIHADMDVPSERPEVGWSASAHANMITGNAFPAKLTRHCEVFFIVFLDKLFLVGAPYIQYVFRVRDRDMYIGARARERERERERWSWSNLKNESIPTERMRRGLLSTAQVSVHLASQFLSCTTTWTQCMISKKEDVWRRDDIWWIHTKENYIISYFVLFSVSFCFCKPLQIVHKLTKRKLRRQFSAKILDKCSGSSKGAKGYLSRGIIHIYLKSAPLSNTPQNFLASSAAQVPPRANNILGDVHTTSVEP